MHKFINLSPILLSICLLSGKFVIYTPQNPETLKSGNYQCLCFTQNSVVLKLSFQRKIELNVILHKFATLE